MNFQEVAERYQFLKSRFEKKEISAGEFEAQVNNLQVTTEPGALWQIGVKTGKWYRYDGADWVEDTPPVIPPPTNQPAPLPGHAPLPPVPPPQPDPSPAKPKKRRGKAGMIILLVLVALVTLIAILFFTHVFTITINGVDILKPARTVLMQDDFSNIDSGWDKYSGSDGFLMYGMEGFRFYLAEPNLLFWSSPHRNIGPDVSAEVDVTLMDGPKNNNNYGIICRYDSSDPKGSYYALFIGSEGMVGIGISVNGETRMISSQELQTSPFVKTGYNVTNHLRADCVGNTLTLYVNGQKVITTTDTTYPKGDVGLMAGSFDVAGAEGFFDNFIVYKP